MTLLLSDQVIVKSHVVIEIKGNKNPKERMNMIQLKAYMRRILKKHFTNKYKYCHNHYTRVNSKPGEF